MPYRVGIPARPAIMQAKPHLYCPLCGDANQCAPAQSGSLDSPCWCRTAQINPAALALIPSEQRGEACLCPRCAQLSTPPASSD